MQPTLRHIVVTAALLTLFSVVGTWSIALLDDNTHDIIAENKRKELLRTLSELVPASLYDNDPVESAIMVRDRPLLGSYHDVAVYRATRDDKPVAIMMTPIAPDGYSGNIGLLVAIDTQTDSLLGVRVLWHKETPGLGDWIETEKSDWVLNFTGRSLGNPDELGWHVRKDGGIFDQVTGATITPRAIVKAVYNTLRYYQQHKAELLDMAPESSNDESAAVDDTAAVDPKDSGESNATEE
ncbi:MAG: electron transport complex subunit RsxG [Chromatiales bacterium]|jgi:electron transport complex protein RnfG|nr:electron transport complex subunit RsxG [Chromatiales bacterium]